MAIAVDVVFESHLAQFYKSIGYRVASGKQETDTKASMVELKFVRNCLTLFKKLQIFEKTY